MKKWGLILLLLFLMLSQVLVGCRSVETNEKTQEAASEPQTHPSKDTLIYGGLADAIALDPAIVDDGPSYIVTTQVFERLLSFKPGSFEVQPALAESYEVSPDGLTYTFALRKGVKFHDGTDFNADAVVFNFQRWSDPKSAYRFKGESFPMFDSVFGPPEDRFLKEVKAVDPYKVQFLFRKPLASFIQSLAIIPFGIASPTAIKEKKEKFKEEPVGTGPFVFKEWKHNDFIKVEKNPTYWNKDYPKLNQVIFRMIPDKSSLVTALQAGEIDLFEGYSVQEMGAVEADSEFQLVSKPPNNAEFIGFNTKKKPFNDPRVRIALNYAVNKKQLKETFYATRDDIHPAINPLPRGMLGYNEDIQDYDYDPQKAKALLREAGYPNGIEQELVFYTIPIGLAEDQGVKIAEVIQAEFAKIGVKVKIETPELATYLADIEAGKPDMFVMTWGGDNGDPDNFLYTVFTMSDSFMFYNNPEYKQLLQKAREATVREKRIELYKQAQVILKKDAPIIPLFESGLEVIAKRNMKGYIPLPNRYSDPFTAVYFE
ncbi:UNVERIFIED_CONTAM: peptide/nickel transport system substrate-binding protein [Brevibacillus sp. OAP136]